MHNVLVFTTSLKHTSHMRTASRAAPTSYIDLEVGHFYRQACAPDRKKAPFTCKTLCFSFLPEVTENCYFLFPTGDHSGEDGRPPTWYLYIVGGAFGGPSSTAGLTACMALAPRLQPSQPTHSHPTLPQYNLCRARQTKRSSCLGAGCNACRTRTRVGDRHLLAVGS